MFFEALDSYRTLDFNSNPINRTHFENNFKRTINCPVTRANTNEPRGLTGVNIALWRTLFNSGEAVMRTVYCYIAYLTSQSNDSAIQNESKWKFQWRKPGKVAFSQYKSRDEPEWRCWPGVAPVTAYLNFRWFTFTLS